MGLIHHDDFIVRLAESEADCMTKWLNRKALGAWSKTDIERGTYWLERWDERKSRWIEIRQCRV